MGPFPIRLSRSEGIRNNAETREAEMDKANYAPKTCVIHMITTLHERVPALRRHVGGSTHAASGKMERLGRQWRDRRVGATRAEHHGTECRGALKPYRQVRPCGCAPETPDVKWFGRPMITNAQRARVQHRWNVYTRGPC